MTEDETARSYRLIKLLKSLKIKQKRFAEEIGVKPVYVSHLVNRHRKITFEMAQKISRSYHVRTEWLLNGDGEMLIDEKRPAGVSEVNEASPWDRPVKGGEALLDAFKTLFEGYEQRISDLESRVKRLETGAD